MLEYDGERLTRVIDHLNAVRGAARILDETVVVGVAVAVDPVKRSLDLRPDRMDEREVGRALEVGVSEHDEQRRGVDAPVVAPEWNLAQCRHFPRAHLVQDLPGLGVAGGVDFRGLRRGEEGQHAAREVRPQP